MINFQIARAVPSLATFIGVFALAASLFAPLSASAAGEVFTNPATGITASDATLNGTVGGVAASNVSFWVSLAPGIDTSNPFVIPGGTCSTPVLPGAPFGAGVPFSESLSTVTTSGVPCNLPAITETTNYYYVAWAEVAGTWYPGSEQSLTTLKLDQSINVTTNAPANETYNNSFDVEANATSGLGVAISVTGGNCSVTAGGTNTATVKMTKGTGNCTVHYNQAGDATYNPAPEVTEVVDADPIPLTITAVTDTKVYDGTTSSVGVPSITGTIVMGDTPMFTQEYSTKDWGIGNKTLEADGEVDDGNSGNNYDYTFVDFTTGTITKRTLTVTAEPDTKPYDGNNSSSVSPSADAVQGGDVENFSQTFDNENVGAGKTLTPTGFVNDGNSGENYTYIFVPMNTGVIEAIDLSVTGITASNKVYDNTTSATLNFGGATFVGLVGGDDVTLQTGAAAGAFSDEHVDTGKTVTITGLSVTGSDVGNYVFDTTSTATADITARPITAKAQAVNKVYDGTNASGGTVGLIAGSYAAGDTSGFFQTYSDENVGAGKTISVNGTVNDGNGGNNYAVTIVNDLGDITKATLTVTADSETITYGDTDPAPHTFVYSGFEDDDTDADVDTDASCDVAGMHENAGSYSVTCSGASDNNYNFTYVNGTLTVEKADPTIVINDYDVTYDTFSHTSTIDTAEGVNSEDLSAGVDLSGTEHTDAGTYDDTWYYWDFTGNYNNASGPIENEIDPAPQSITFDPLADKNFGDADFAVSATADSNVDGLAVYFEASGACTVTGDIVHLTTKGVCTITAYQDGNNNWNAASSVEQSFDVYDVTGPVITLTGGDMEVASQDADFTDPGYSATDDVDGSVPVTVGGDTVNLRQVGTYVVTYDAEDEEGNPAAQVTRTVTVVHIPQGTGGGSRSGGSSGQSTGEVLGAQTDAVGHVFTADLYIGMVGNDVIELQKVLIALGYLQIPAPTGYFGPLTQAAVKLYQAAHGIITTGYVGPLTRAALNAGGTF